MRQIGDAIASARNRVQIAAQAVGMIVSGIQSISLNDVYFPVFSEFQAVKGNKGRLLHV